MSRAAGYVAVLALLAAGCLSAPAAAAEKAIWGPNTLPDGSSAFPTYEQLGVDTLQRIVDWSEVAPTRPAAPQNPADPAYHWPPDVDTAVNEARAHGIGVALLVTRSPGWANGGRAPIWAPSRPQDYANFMIAAARRYPSVHRWMIWGEPNRDDRFLPNKADDPIAPRTYASILDAAYGALRTQSRRNIVIGGMTWTGGTVKPRDFLRWMRLPNGARPRLNWYGHNPFPFRFPNLSKGPLRGYRDISDVDTLSREVRRAYNREVPLWLSEYTIQTNHASNVFATFVSEQGQANYVRAGYAIADGLDRRVAGLGWLSLIDEPEATGSANWGLMTYALKRKPSFAALAGAPSERFRPTVSVQRVAGGSRVRLRVSITPRLSGTVRVELRRGSRRLDVGRLRGTAGRRRTVRLEHAPRIRGRFTVIVRASRGATVRRNVRVR